VDHHQRRPLASDLSGNVNAVGSCDVAEQASEPTTIEAFGGP
jgi:hypothetical protein